MAAGLVSIGIACFNARDTIGRALASALSQDWPVIEVIIVDDRSTDGSAEIVAGLIAGEARARLVRHGENRGVGAARNTILAEARGEFVAFFDDDDESLPGRVSAQVTALTAHEVASRAERVACYAAGTRLYDNGYSVDAPAIGAEGPVPQGAAVAEALLVYRRNRDWSFGSGVPASALLARRAAIEAAEGFDPGLRRLEDVDFAIRFALRGAHFVGTRERLYVRHMTQGTDKSPEAGLEAELAIARKHAAYLRSIGRYEYARRWPRLRYWHFRRRYDRFAVELVGLLMRHPAAATAQLFSTGPARLLHEHKMRKRPPA